MQKILLPIKDKYSQAILAKTKNFELRRTIPKKKVDVIVIYSTFPVKKVVGQAFVKYIHKLALNELWNLTKGKNFVSEDEFYLYYSNKSFGYAYEIADVEIFDEPKTLEDYKISYSPQGFVYL